MSWMKVKKIDPNAIVPHRAHDTDAGLDVFCVENVGILEGSDAVIRTGISIAIPDGWVAVVKEKSGRATKNKLTVGACVIDSGYRGELLIHLFNNGDVPVTLLIGEKIAQLVVVPCWTGQPEEVDELDETERGEGRFGSTGISGGIEPGELNILIGGSEPELTLPTDREYFHRKSTKRSDEILKGIDAIGKDDGHTPEFDRDQIWANVYKAAEDCPLWMKRKINELFDRDEDGNTIQPTTRPKTETRDEW